MRSLRDKSILLFIIFFATGYGEYTKFDVNYERSGGNGTLKTAHIDASRKLIPACYIKPQWHVCKYQIMKWQREFRWRAYYDSDDDECYYFRGCPDTNKELFTFDVDCREACVHEKDKQLKAHYNLKSGRCRYFTDCGDDRNKNFWTNIGDCTNACVTNKLSKKRLNKKKPNNNQ